MKRRSMTKSNDLRSAFLRGHVSRPYNKIAKSNMFPLSAAAVYETDIRAGHSNESCILSLRLTYSGRSTGPAVEGGCDEHSVDRRSIATTATVRCDFRLHETTVASSYTSIYAGVAYRRPLMPEPRRWKPEGSPTAELWEAIGTLW